MERHPTGRWLDEGEARAWRGFVEMSTQLNARIRRNLQRDSGMSDADYAVLVNLTEATGARLRAFELGAALQWEKSRLSHHLTRMERRGLVVREQCPSDARGAFVVATDAGHDAIAAAAPSHVDDVRRYFIDVLSPAQLDAVTEIAEAVLDALASDRDDAAFCD